LQKALPGHPYGISMTFSATHEARTYRDFGPSDRFTTFRVVVETSDLYVKAYRALENETEKLIRKYRSQVEYAIARRSEFLTSMEPLEGHEDDPPIAARMIAAGKKAGTGPMAAVAGAIAQFVGQELLQWSPELIVENGGDIFLKVAHPVLIGIFAGNSPFSGKLGIRVEPTVLPLGVCTSSSSVGPSMSWGRADAATVVSKDVALADAVATQLGNKVIQPGDLKDAVRWAVEVPGVEGALAVMGDKLAALGDLELVPLSESDKEVKP
jgi:ApbE superfamily uncharacterized protein (UPF0280 family)